VGDGPTGFANPRLGIALVAGSGSTYGVANNVVLSNSPSVTWGGQLSASSLVVTATASVTGIGTAIQSISAGTTQATTGQVVFSNSGVVWGVNGQTITAGAPRVSMWQNHPRAVSSVILPFASTALPAGVGNVFFNRVSLFAPIQATRAILSVNISNNTQSSGAYTLQLGLYTLSQSTASLASSASVAVSWTTGQTGLLTSVTSVYGGQSSIRARTIGLGTWNMSAGEYLIGILGSFAGGGQRTWQFNGSGPQAIVSMPGTLSTVPYFPPQGSYSVGTSKLPGSVRVQDLAASINQNNISGVPSICFVGTF
jgi:hypothetical protein